MTRCSFTIGLFEIEFGLGFDTFKILPTEINEGSNAFTLCVNKTGFSVDSGDAVVGTVDVCNNGSATMPLIK